MLKKSAGAGSAKDQFDKIEEPEAYFELQTMFMAMDRLAATRMGMVFPCALSAERLRSEDFALGLAESEHYCIIAPPVFTGYKLLSEFSLNEQKACGVNEVHGSIKEFVIDNALKPDSVITIAYFDSRSMLLAVRNDAGSPIPFYCHGQIHHKYTL